MTDINQAIVDPTPETLSPLAIVHGQIFDNLPKDLYIPPDAMKVLLDAFEGPLDLLLYLIRKQNIDVLNIPIAEVTRQYMEYVDIMKTISLELAGEYLVMAAILAEIKSRMLLPRPPELGGTDEDPRAELIRRLQEYERFKKAAEDMDQLPREGRDTFVAELDSDNIIADKPQPTVSLQELVLAFADALKRATLHTSHDIKRDSLSVRDKMTLIIESLHNKEFITFSSLFNPSEGRLGIVVTFLAMLELLKDRVLQLVQAIPFGPIHLTTLTAADA